MTVLRISLLLVACRLVAETVRLTPFSQVHVDLAPPPRDVVSVTETLRSSDGALWTKRERGADRDRRLFHSKRFLPCDEVKGFSESKPGRVRVHTQCGDSEIWFEPITLAAKAALYLRTAARHDRHGLVADMRQNKTVSNDNDGLWTAMFAVSQLFEYKVTADAQALARADRATRAVLFLEKITGTPGYPARSYIAAGEERPKDGFWYPSADGKYWWKSDTSSDELVGHFLLFSVAWDLLPHGELRKDIRETCRRMMDTILANGYYLIDPKTGKPTRWGKWSPAYFDKEGRSDSPLNALELISFLTTAAHVTGDARYRRELQKVERDLGYLKIASEVKERQDELNYSDEELAMLSFYPLMRYGAKPEILRALDGWFENIRRERNPLWNSIYELARGENPSLRRESILTLERLPIDLRSWTIENSWRKELPVAPDKDRFARKQTTVWIPPDERATMKWNGNPFVLDGGNGGQSEDDGTIFLLPYWMGRYHKLWGER